MNTTICIPLTTNLRWANAPGNVFLPAGVTGLPHDSVANVSQIVAVDRRLLTERAGKLGPSQVDTLLDGIEIAIGRRSEPNVRH